MWDQCSIICNHTQVLFVRGPAADATDTPQPWGLFCNSVMKMISFFVFPCNVAPVEWNWQGKTEVLGEKPVPVPLCPPQIPHGLTRDSAVRGRRLTAWVMARPPTQVITHESIIKIGGNIFKIYIFTLYFEIQICVLTVHLWAVTLVKLKNTYLIRCIYSDCVNFKKYNCINI